MTNGRDKWEGGVDERLTGIEFALGEIKEVLEKLPCHDHDKRLMPLENDLKDRLLDRRAWRNAWITRVVIVLVSALGGGGVGALIVTSTLGGG